MARKCDPSVPTYLWLDNDPTHTVKAAQALFPDWVLSTFGAATATGLSAMVDGDVSHDQVTRFLSAQAYTSKDLRPQAKPTVRSIELDDGVLIFDDTIQEKAWTDESELMCWHYEHCSGRTVRGINLLNALYDCNDTAIPVAFEWVKKPIQFSDIATKKLKRKSEKAKTAFFRVNARAPLTQGIPKSSPGGAPSLYKQRRKHRHLASGLQ
jgi:hypothetical protein